MNWRINSYESGDQNNFWSFQRYATNDGEALTNFFKSYPEALLTAQKANTFKALVSHPLATVEVVDEAYTELQKIFDADGGSISLDLGDEKKVEEFQKYRVESNEVNFWKTKGWDVLRYHPCAILLIDQIEQGKPYIRVIPVELWVEVELDYLGCISKFTFVDPEKLDDEGEPLIITYDKDNIIIKDSNDKVTTEKNLLKKVPAIQLLDSKLADNSLMQANPVAPLLGELDKILWYKTTLDHLTNYAGFPIIASYAQVCNYKSDDGVCDSGYIVPYAGDGSTSKGVRKCPKCNSGRELYGAGTNLKVPIPDKEAGIPALLPAVDITKGDTAAITTMEDSIEKRVKQFLKNVVGGDYILRDDFSKHEKQIDAATESRQSVLERLSEQFERAQQFCLEVMCQYMYGVSSVKKIKVVWGKKYFLKTSHQLTEDLKNSKESGVPFGELQNIRYEIYHKKYREDPDMMMRSFMLEHLEPYRDLTIKEVQEMLETLNEQKVGLKMNFTDLLAEFELENGRIERYLPDAPINTRITNINTWLNSRVPKGTELKTPKMNG